MAARGGAETRRARSPRDMDIAGLTGWNTRAWPPRNGSAGIQQRIAGPWRRSGGRRGQSPRAGGCSGDLGQGRSLVLSPRGTVLSRGRVFHGHDRLTQLRNGEQWCPTLPFRPPDQDVTGRQVPNPELGYVVLPELQADVPFLAPRWSRQLRWARPWFGRSRSRHTRDPGQRGLLVAVVPRPLR
jgi:hypothetical protein